MEYGRGHKSSGRYCTAHFEINSIYIQVGGTRKQLSQNYGICQRICGNSETMPSTTVLIPNGIRWYKFSTRKSHRNMKQEFWILQTDIQTHLNPIFLLPYPQLLIIKSLGFIIWSLKQYTKMKSMPMNWKYLQCTRLLNQTMENSTHHPLKK